MNEKNLSDETSVRNFTIEELDRARTEFLNALSDYRINCVSRDEFNFKSNKINVYYKFFEENVAHLLGIPHLRNLDELEVIKYLKEKYPKLTRRYRYSYELMRDIFSTEDIYQDFANYCINNQGKKIPNIYRIAIKSSCIREAFDLSRKNCVLYRENAGQGKVRYYGLLTRKDDGNGYLFLVLKSNGAINSIQYFDKFNRGNIVVNLGDKITFRYVDGDLDERRLKITKNGIDPLENLTMEVG